MKIHTIEGEIETLGESWKQQGRMKTYDYISIRTKTGQDVVVRKIRVWDEVDRLLSPGMHGTFIITEMWWQKEMQAARTTDREAMSEFLQGSTTKAYVGASVLLLLGLLLSLFVIGIPLVVLAIWILVSLGPWRRKLLDATSKAGFRHVAAKLI